MSKFILAMGGQPDSGYSNTVDVFEVQDNTVVKREDISLSLSEGRYYLSAASAGKFILCMGGWDSSSGPSSSAVDVFEVKDNTVVKRTDINLSLSPGRTGLSAASAGNFILAMGGAVGGGPSFNTVDVFEVQDNTVVKRDDLSLSVNVARYSLSAASAGNFILCMGGWIGSSSSSAVDVFEVKDNTVVQRTDLSLSLTLSEARYNLSAASCGNFILCMGGWIGNGSYSSNAVDVFEVKDNTVVKRTDINLSLSEGRTGLSAASAGNFILAMGGEASGSSSAVDVFEVQDNTVVKRTDINLSLSEARYYLSAASAGNFILCIGGYNGTSYSNAVDVFEVVEE